MDTLRLNGVVALTNARVAGYRYRTNVGRLDSLVQVAGPQRYLHDPSGNLEFDYQPNGGPGHDDRFSYYSADGLLRATDAREYRQLEPGRLVFEQYRYDALGRRIWVRTDRQCDPTLYFDSAVACDVSTIRRTVWDGARELLEIQTPVKYAGASVEEPASVQDNDFFTPNRPLLNFEDPNPFFGRVLYVHGLPTDRPLAVMRIAYVGREGGVLVAHPPQTLSLFWTAQGQLKRAICASGAALPACVASSGGATDTLVVSLPEQWFAWDRPAYRVQSFQGTLLTDKADGTGTYFRRHRFYDPRSGRFTQEDPIGLAGG